MSKQKLTKTHDEWIPTPKQLAVLEAAKEGGFLRSISAITMEAGVSRFAFYDWMKTDEHFKKAWEDIPRQMLSSARPGVYSALIKKAETGDVAANKLVLELIGDYVQTTKTEIEVSIADELKRARERVRLGGAVPPGIEDHENGEASES